MVAFLLPFFASGQLYTASNGHVSFFSKAPLEDIEAHTRSMSGALKTDTRTLAFSIPIKSFEFQRSLMREHFNDRFMESDQYPKATFTGVLLEEVDLTKPGTYPVTAKGQLTIHGVTQERTINGVIISGNNRLAIVSEFPVSVAAHNVKIPRLLFESIAEVVNVKVNITLKPAN